MNKRWNRSWIAGAIAAACALVLVCVVALPKGAQPQTPPSHGNQQVEINLPSSEKPSQTADTPAETQHGAAERIQNDPYGGMQYEPGVVLVTLPAGVSPSDALAAIVEETGLEGVGFADESDASAQAATAAETPLLVELSVPADMPMSQAVDLISATSAVDAAQPNFVYHLNDADAGDSETQARGALVAQNFIVQDLVTQAVSVNDAADQWMLPSIYAYNDTTGVGNAWDITRSDQVSSNRVTVAVIDEGFQANHPDLVGNVVETYNATNGSTDVSEVSGQGGHGTHVAGVVAATANNGRGVAGVSHNARLLLIKGMNNSGGFNSSDLARAMDYARGKKSAYNIRVINMSIGGGTTSMANWSDDALIKAIDNAVGAGIAVVCSAGNEFTDTNKVKWNPPYIDYPADYSNVISVMNLTHTGSDPHSVSLASGSNYNDSSTTVSNMNTGKNISAPGTSIRSTYPTSTYNNKSGTSIAAPCVSGVLALVFTKQPNLTVAEATSLLYSTATDIGATGWDQKTGYGEVNAYRAVTEADAYLSGATSVKVGERISLAPAGNNVWLWASSNPAVATVNNGIVTGVSGGTARISATFVFGFIRWALYQNVTVYDPVINGATSATVGSTVKKSVTCTPAGSWKWTSSDTKVATVSSDGTVTALKPGTTTLRVTLSGNSSIYEEQTFTVTKADLSKATITIPNCTYNGSVQKPAPTVKVGNITLSAPADYTLSYPDSNYVAAGTKSVTIKSTGTLTTGNVTKTYAINAIPMSSCTISLGATSLAYTGSAQTPAVTVTYKGARLTKDVDYTLKYTNNTSIGTATATVTGLRNYNGILTKTFTIYDPPCTVQYQTHVQSYGWQGLVKDGAMSGTSGQSKRLEGIKISLPDKKYSGGIQYRTHVQSYGWQGFVRDGAMSGTEGQSKRLEAIQIQLYGEMANHYDVYYRVHCQHIGWMNWAKNGESAGSEGYAYRLEAIQIRVVLKGSAAPSVSPANATSQQFAPLVKYRTHVQTYGWQGYVRDGEVSGTSGQSKRLEGINIALGTTGISGGITYRTHVQTYGWQGWKSNGAMSGTSGESKRLEAIEIKLTGGIADKYDVYYRVHCQKIGWMGWAKNGESAGTAGYAYRLEAIQIRLVPKGGGAPGTTSDHFRSR